MNPSILICDGFEPTLFQQLLKNSSLDVHPKVLFDLDEIKKVIPNINGLVVRSGTKVNKELIDLAPKLKYVIRAGEGTDSIDKNYCSEKDIVVSNTPGANNNSAAEHAIALMLSTLRKIPKANQTLKSGGWDKSSFVGCELWKKKIGLVGFGRIGQIVAKRLAGFEVELQFYDPFIKSSDLSYAKKANDLKDLFSNSDIISIHVPLLKETTNLITKEHLELMPSGCILINAARGGVLNETDLLDYLTNHPEQTAALDVFEKEPLIADSRLRQLDNLILTPHIGASTQEAQFRVGEMVVHQLQDFFVNQTIHNQVNS